MSPRVVLGCMVVLVVSLGVPSIGAAVPRPFEPIEYRFELALREGGEAGIVSITSAARLALRELDGVALGWEREASDAVGIVLRASMLVLVDAVVVSYATMLPHEVLGHGARARELGFDDSYHFSAPLPYALLASRGFANQTVWAPGDRLPATTDEYARFVLGGYDAEEVQLRSISSSSFRSRALGRGDALLYALGRPQLIRSLVGGGDPGEYLGHLVRRYRADPEVEGRLTALSLASALLDPLLLCSLYTTFFRYLARAERSTPYPALRAGAVDLSLTNRLWLVPWGREHRVGLFVGAPSGNAELALRIGEGPGGGSLGIELATYDVALGDLLHLSVGLEAFSQPTLFVLDRSVDRPAASVGHAGLGALGAAPPRLLGVAGSIGIDVRSGKLLAGVRLGAKSVGHLAATPYAPGWTLTLTLGTRLLPLI